jgi:osmotically-inducible protein OsmY
MRGAIRHRKPILAAALVAGLAASGAAIAADQDTIAQDANEAYIHGQLWATYATNPTLEARDIDVDVDDGTVTLQGVVETMGEKSLAGTIADSLDGVATVRNQLRVDPEVVVLAVTPARTFADRVADATVAANVDSMLLWNDYTDGLDIQVSADDGAVTLTGVADTEGSRNRATQVAMSVEGVDSVVNAMTLDASTASSTGNESVSDAWIERTLEHVYLYSDTVNSSLVEADAERGEVSLDGTVDSAFAREVAIQLAQDLRGVARVNADSLSVR